jgi:hypothetical protein
MMKETFELANLREAIDVINRFNKLDLCNVTLLDNGKTVVVDASTINDFEMTGLSNKDFILSGAYLGTIRKGVIMAELGDTIKGRPEVNIVMEKFCELCSNLTEAIESLEKKLSPVLRENATGKDCELAKEVKLVPLAQDIRVNNNQLRQLLQRIEEIEGRLQL